MTYNNHNEIPLYLLTIDDAKIIYDDIRKLNYLHNKYKCPQGAYSHAIKCIRRPLFDAKCQFKMTRRIYSKMSNMDIIHPRYNT